MPINQMLDNAAFDPAAVAALTSAYEDACAALNLNDGIHPLAETVAKRIIEHARRGERDPVRLRELVLKDLQSMDRRDGCPTPAPASGSSHGA